MYCNLFLITRATILIAGVVTTAGPRVASCRPVLFCYNMDDEMPEALDSGLYVVSLKVAEPVDGIEDLTVF